MGLGGGGRGLQCYPPQWPNGPPDDCGQWTEEGELNVEFGVMNIVVYIMSQRCPQNQVQALKNLQQKGSMAVWG